MEDTTSVLISNTSITLTLDILSLLVQLYVPPQLTVEDHPHHPLLPTLPT